MRDFSEKIQFITEGSTSDGAGGSTITRKVELSTRAAIEQLRKSRELEQAQLSLPAVFRVRIMSRQGFFPAINMLVNWRGEDYRIISSPEVDDVRIRKTLTFDITR